MLTVLFVCRGNTCRSAMAEGIAKTLVGDAPITILSAGLEAYDGMRASPEARLALLRRGIDLSAHRARRLTAAMVGAADVIYPMTSLRASGVLQLFPGARGKLHVLDPGGWDIPDPIGTSLDAYIATADALERAIKARIASGLIPAPR